MKTASEQDNPVVRLTPYGITVKALREIKDCYPTGDAGHDIAHWALDEAERRTAENVAAKIFAPEPQPVPRGYDPGAHTLALTVWQQEIEAADAIAARSGTTREVVLRVILKEGLARYGEAAQPAPELDDDDFFDSVTAAIPRPQPAPAPELAAAMGVLRRVLEWFEAPANGGANRTAIVTRAQLAGAYLDGGLLVPEELRKFLGGRGTS